MAEGYILTKGVEEWMLKSKRGGKRGQNNNKTTSL